MLSATQFLPLLLPVLYVLGAIWFHSFGKTSERKTANNLAETNQKMFGMAKIFALMPVPAAVSLLILQTSAGTVDTGSFAMTYISVGLRADLFASVMAVLVTTVGAICLLFSRRYMAGDPDQARFFKFMLLTLGCVTTLILSNTLFLTVCAWVAMSLSLHRLLLFYPDRAAAQRAASKKYVAARIGDLCLIAAAVLLVVDFGTDQISTIMTLAKSQPAFGVGSIFAAFLIVVAALMKSAQFPFNGWLVEVMETPTPVSALLHAGVVNAGGFLVIRFSDLLLQSPEAMWLLALAGGTTTVVASIAMISQTSVKVGLAWSTVAQMGLMILQCGLGAFSAAALHIVAHSLYKAYAFLSAGSAIDQDKMPLKFADARFTPTLFYSGLLILSASLVVTMASVVNLDLLAHPGVVLLTGLFVLGTMHLISAFFMLEKIDTAAIGGLGVMLLVVSVSYGALHHFAPTLLGANSASMALATSAKFSWTLAIVLALAGIMIIQWMNAAGTRPVWLQTLLIHASNGFYASAYADRLLQNRQRPVLTSPATTRNS